MLKIGGVKMIRKISKKYEDYFYFVFRVLVGLLFFQHGAQKIFGWFGGRPAELTSLFGVAGIIELVLGAAITIGLLTRLMAVIGGIEMIAAYFIVHAPQGLIPIVNQGELALLYLAAFFVLIVHGARKWSLDSLVKGAASRLV